MNKVVIALGGNALGDDVKTQIENTNKCALSLFKIINDNYKVIITHGNGPQVGLINLAFEEGMKVNNKICEMPFVEATAMSCGYIGFHLQNALSNVLLNNNINKCITPIITRVLVDKNDVAFDNPTKPVGSFMTLDEAKKCGYKYIEDANRGYRRVVASPNPIKILESEAIKTISEDNICICTGGGGVPVIYENNSYLGISCVIDKDKSSCKLAIEINADILLILTQVKNAYINFNKENQKALNKVSLNDIIKYNNEGHFLKGSMKPKIESAIEFVKSGENKIAIITDIENAYDALKFKCGTIITN